MSGYVLSAEAEEDTFQIWRYLAEKAGIETANRITSRFYETFELLLKTPGAWVTNDLISPNIP